MTTTVEKPQSKSPEKGAALDVLLIFLRLGLTSFGGPIAHIGYFRDEFVTRRRWLDEQAYADLVALCQFLPGPASSQVGFSHRADARRLSRGPCGVDRIHVAVCHRAGAVRLRRGFARRSARHRTASWSEARGGRDRRAGGMGHGAHALPRSGARVDCDGGGAAHSVEQLPVAQIGAILLGAVAGLWLCRGAPPQAVGHVTMPVSRRAGACGARGILDPAGWGSSGAASPVARRHRLVRGVLSLRRAGVRRRPCRAAAVAGSLRHARLGQR